MIKYVTRKELDDIVDTLILSGKEYTKKEISNLYKDFSKDQIERVYKRYLFVIEK